MGSEGEDLDGQQNGDHPVSDGEDLRCQQQNGDHPVSDDLRCPLAKRTIRWARTRINSKKQTRAI